MGLFAGLFTWLFQGRRLIKCDSKSYNSEVIEDIYNNKSRKQGYFFSSDQTGIHNEMSVILDEFEETFTAVVWRVFKKSTKFFPIFKTLMI